MMIWGGKEGIKKEKKSDARKEVDKILLKGDANPLFYSQRFMSTNNTPTYKDLEIVPNEYNKRDYVIKVSIPEFNCVCPRTSLPDFGCINIEYTPNEYIVEGYPANVMPQIFINLSEEELQALVSYLITIKWMIE